MVLLRTTVFGAGLDLCRHHAGKHTKHTTSEVVAFQLMGLYDKSWLISFGILVLLLNIIV